MTSEVPVTPEPAAEPAPQATPPVTEEPKPEEKPAEKPQEPKQETDWRAAYVGNQTNLNKLHTRVDDLLNQNRALGSAITSLKQGQTELVRSTLGEDKAREMAARDAAAMAAEAQSRAAQAATTYMSAQAEVILAALAAVGVSPNDPSIDWANDAPDVATWKSRVLPSVQTRIQRANEERIAAERKTLTAKSQAEIKAEAEALAQRQLKESGVDRIDTARGQASGSLVERIRSMKPGSPEYQKFADDVASGRLKV